MKKLSLMYQGVQVKGNWICRIPLDVLSYEIAPSVLFISEDLNIFELSTCHSIG